jgi:predicted DNA-binding ribbon-helix-helix protein
MIARGPTEQVRRNFEIGNRRTSFSLEAGVWDTLLEICRREAISIDGLFDDIIANAQGVSMASAVRTYALEYFMDLAIAKEAHD